VSSVATTCSIFTIVLLLWGTSVRAQIVPFHGSLEYSATKPGWPEMIVKARNGSPAYVIKFVPDGPQADHVNHIDLFMQRPRANADASNLLEPEGNWHGLQAYDFVASDFVQGAEHSGFGPTRHIQIKRRKLDVTFSIIKAAVHHVDRPAPADYAFDDLTLEVVITNIP